MPLDIDQHRPLPAPAGDGTGQRRQQHLLGPGAVRGRHLLQQRLGLLRRQRDRDAAGGAFDVAARSTVPRQGGDAAPALVEPVRQLGVPGARRCMLGQAPGPAAEGGRRGRQRGGFAARELAARGLEVREQDAPRDGVDRQVMDRQEQPPRLVGAELEQGGADQRPGGQIEGPLQAAGHSLQSCGPPCAGRLGEVGALERHALARGGAELLPPVCPVPEAQAKRVVVGDERLQGSLEDLRVEAAPHLEQHRLVEVLRIGPPLLEEAALDRGQRHRPELRLLTGRRRAPGLDERYQLGDRRVLEQLPRRQAQACLAGAGRRSAC